MDFGVLPPEVNSGRMYAGPGAAQSRWSGTSIGGGCPSCRQGTHQRAFGHIAVDVDDPANPARPCFACRVSRGGSASQASSLATWLNNLNSTPFGEGRLERRVRHQGH